MKVELRNSEKKRVFRNKFVDFFNDCTKSDIKIDEKVTYKVSAEKLVSENFKLLNGNCFNTVDEKLLISVYRDDNIITLFVKQKDFILRKLI